MHLHTGGQARLIRLTYRYTKAMLQLFSSSSKQLIFSDVLHLEGLHELFMYRLH